MQIVVVGLNHKAAPIEVRERLAFTPTQQEPALAALLERVAEGVILSTCNRTELYAVVDDADSGVQSVIAFLGEFHKLPAECYAPHLYRRRGREAVAHLFAVASGIDSMILGEPQILGQVRAAYETAASYRAVGPILSRVFHCALKVGKQVRSETHISRSAASISYAAVELARKVLGNLAGRTVLIVGAGKMAELAAQALLDDGLAGVVVTNRTYARAAELAAKFGGRAADFALLPELVAGADVVITCSAAPGFILDLPLVRLAMAGRHHRPLLLVDIAVPRDVDPLVQSLSDVFLYDVDDLQAVCASNLEERRKEVGKVQTIVDAEVEAFEAWLQSLQVVPTISALCQRGEEIRQAELQKALRRLGDLSERQRSTLEALSIAIVNKMLHQPIVQLKAKSNSREGAEYSRTLRRLFALDEGS